MGSRHVPHPDSPLTCTAPQGKLGAGGLQGRTAQTQGRAFCKGAGLFGKGVPEQGQSAERESSNRTTCFAACLAAVIKLETRQQRVSWSLLAHRHIDSQVAQSLMWQRKSLIAIVLPYKTKWETGWSSVSEEMRSTFSCSVSEGSSSSKGWANTRSACGTNCCREAVS